MARKPGMSVFEMLFDILKTFLVSILRFFGHILGGAIAAGCVGGIGGSAVALYYGYPIVLWMIGGFVVCAILALVLMVFVASDL